MMTRIHGCKPDTGHDQRKQTIPPPKPAPNAIIQYNQWIRCMQRRHGCKHIAALGIEPREDVHMEKAVPTAQPGRITRRMRVKHKTVLLHIPGRRRGKDIINDKPQQIDEQKAERHPEKDRLVRVEKVTRECQRQRDPAEIETARRDVERHLPVCQPILVRRLTMDAEQSLLETIDIRDMHGIVPVIWKSLHEVEQDPKNDEGRETENEPSRRPR